MDKSDVISKVRKMMALADGNANENESMLALAKAHEFMKRHGIEMLELNDNGLELEADTWETDWKSQIDSYSKIIAAATAKLFDCEWWMHRPGRRMKYKVKLVFAGEEMDLKMAQEIWPWLTKMAGKLARSYMGPGWTPSHRCFAEGFAMRINQRVQEMMAEDECDQKYGLVVAAKKDAIVKMKEAKGIEVKIKPAPLRGGYDPAAAHAGQVAGDGVNLNFNRGGKSQPIRQIGR